MVGLPTSINPINKSLIGNRYTLGQLNLDNVSLFPIHCDKSAVKTCHHTGHGQHVHKAPKFNHFKSRPRTVTSARSNKIETLILELIKSLCHTMQMLALFLSLPFKKQPPLCDTLKMCQCVATRNKPSMLNSTKVRNSLTLAACIGDGRGPCSQEMHIAEYRNKVQRSEPFSNSLEKVWHREIKRNKYLQVDLSKKWIFVIILTATIP